MLILGHQFVFVCPGVSPLVNDCSLRSQLHVPKLHRALNLFSLHERVPISPNGFTHSSAGQLSFQDYSDIIYVLEPGFTSHLLQTKLVELLFSRNLYPRSTYPCVRCFFGSTAPPRWVSKPWHTALPTNTGLRFPQGSSQWL